MIFPISAPSLSFMTRDWRVQIFFNSFVHRLLTRNSPFHSFVHRSLMRNNSFHSSVLSFCENFKFFVFRIIVHFPLVHSFSNWTIVKLNCSFNEFVCSVKRSFFNSSFGKTNCHLFPNLMNLSRVSNPPKTGFNWAPA